MDSLNRKDEFEIEAPSKQYYPDSGQIFFDLVLYQSNLTEKLLNRNTPLHSEHHHDSLYEACGQT